MELATPNTLSEALHRIGEAPSWTPIAGGTDLLVHWPARPKQDLRLLDLSRLRGDLGAVRLTSDALELGALTTYWDVISSAPVRDAFPLLAIAARQVGAIQIQTRGTWAGNIGNGSPAADGVLAMLAYDAVVVLQSAESRREVPLRAYWTGYKQAVRRANELIVAIRMPRRARIVEWFHKVGARSAQTITKVGVAVVRDEAGWRVCANSMAPFVCHCPHLEAALQAGRVFATPAEVRDMLSRDLSPIDDMRSTASYRMNVLARLLFAWMQDGRQ